MLRDHWSIFESTISRTLNKLALANRNFRSIEEDLQDAEAEGPDPLDRRGKDTLKRADQTAWMIDGLYWTIKENPSDGGDAHERAFDSLLQAVLDAHPTKSRDDLKDGTSWVN